MSQTSPSVPTGVSIRDFRAIVSRHRTWFIVLGIVLVLLGAGAIVFPFITTIAAKIFLGWLFLIGGIEFTSFAWHRTSELAELPLWMIHIAWPVAAVTWIVFLGEQFYDEARILFGGSAT